MTPTPQSPWALSQENSNFFPPIKLILQLMQNYHWMLKTTVSFPVRLQNNFERVWLFWAWAELLFVLKVNVNMLWYTIGQTKSSCSCTAALEITAFPLTQMTKKLIYCASVKSRECITEDLLEHPELTIQKYEKISQNGNSIIRHRASTVY